MTQPRTETPGQRDARLASAERVVQHEWQQFQVVQNQGGPAECQSNWPVFHQMRISQFVTWPAALIAGYGADLEAADSSGRNLLTEKYARMMKSTEPEYYASHIEPSLPMLSSSRAALQERIIAVQVAWAEDFTDRFPRLGSGMRTLHTSQDTVQDTSLETYLRGELGTYSTTTLARYAEFVDSLAAAGLNLTEMTVSHTVGLAGFASLEAAEAAGGAA